MGRILAAVFLIGLLLVSFFTFWDNEFVVESPLPAVFGAASGNEKNEWFPQSKKDTPADIYLGAKSAILVDYESGEVVFSKDSTGRYPAASTTKIMTALVALENVELEDRFVVSEKAFEVGENSMGLTTGEELTLFELMYGAMLVSGNDAAVTIAEGVGGSEENFVSMMNAKAKELGLRDTKFVNASGLDEDGKTQYSSAYDLVTLARYVWEKHPVFREVSATFNKYIEANETHKAFDLYNDTNLLTTYPGVRGIKPGFTWEAGLCLVTYAENDGKKLIGVILGSDDRRGEMKELLDYGFGKYGITVSHPDLDL